LLSLLDGEVVKLCDEVVARFLCEVVDFLGKNEKRNKRERRIVRLKITKVKNLKLICEILM
jgi:hypothetical protein